MNIIHFINGANVLAIIHFASAEDKKNSRVSVKYFDSSGREAEYPDKTHFDEIDRLCDKARSWCERNNKVMWSY